MLADLTDAMCDSSSCSSFALGLFSYFHQHLQEKEVPESVDILKPPHVDSLFKREIICDQINPSSNLS